MMRNLLALAVLASLAVAMGLVHAGSPPSSLARPDQKTPPEKRALREGAEIEGVGTFKITGNRVMYCSEDGLSLAVLENLALERVLRMLENSRQNHDWVVVGMVTEFRGNNYMLLKRAIIKSKQDAGDNVAAESREV